MDGHLREHGGRGLTSAQAAQRLKKYGYNELPSDAKESFAALFLRLLAEPMIALLLVCGIIYLAVGEPRESVSLFVGVLIVVGITLYQERKTEKTLAALRDMSSPRALVVRDKSQMRIAGRDVVPGDVVLLAEGDRVPADARIIECSHLMADESLLTGESVSVSKAPSRENISDARPGGEGSPFVWSGTLIVSGHAIAEVFATGEKSEIGKIGVSLKSVSSSVSPLEQGVRKFVFLLAVIGGVLSAAVALFYVLATKNIVQGVLQGIALAMALLPEEFPVILTVFLAIGAWRISARRVLTRRIPAIETLGTITRLCADKTGTITKNEMSLHKVWTPDGSFEAKHSGKIPDSVHVAVRVAALAGREILVDPIEKAIFQCAARIGEGMMPEEGAARLREYPFTEDLAAHAHAWTLPESKGVLVAATGAPEAIVDLCRVPRSRASVIEGEIGSMAKEGMRVIAVAESRVRGEKYLPSSLEELPFSFLGLIAFEDPVREEVPAAINECHAAGVHVCMITGDYAGTAEHVARAIGLPDGRLTVKGDELDHLEGPALHERIRSATIFARIVPSQKLKIVEGYKAMGEIVAMTGDGINDAPALKSAHVGVAMGARGTDVAREASSLVLMNDDFSSIVGAIRTGRRIFDNIRKAMSYVLSVHIPIAGVALLPVLSGGPTVFLPLHIALIELIIDPASSIVFEAEPEEEDVMMRPPRKSDEPLLSRATITASLIEGSFVFLLCAASYFVMRSTGASDDVLRSFVFLLFIFCNAALIVANLVHTGAKGFAQLMKNFPFWLLMGGISVFSLLLFCVPALREIFRLAPLTFFQAAVALGISGVALFALRSIMFLTREKK